MASSRDKEPVGIDPQTPAVAGRVTPYHVASMRQIRVPQAWEKYADRLTFGRGQCLAILDDGCDVSVPPWRVTLPWGPKVVATWNSIDGNEDCMHVPPGYHGTTVGFPSSLNHENSRGVAYNNHVAHVRCVTCVHLTQDESATMAAGLQWVIEHRQKLNITAVNLAPLDDQRHCEPMATAIDAKLNALREAGVWVSAPCGNHHYTDGISWPACQPWCYGIGATVPEGEETCTAGAGRPDVHKAHLDRFRGTDLLVAAEATSSSNAYAAASAMVLREAIDATGYAWRGDGPNLPEAIMAIFHRTGVAIHDEATGLDFRELDLLAALDHVFGA